MDTQALIISRGQTHGDFAGNADVSQQIKWAMRDAYGSEGNAWSRLTTVQQEALEMIALKISRIVTGDANFKDHWDDIAGYAMLAASRCK